MSFILCELFKHRFTQTLTTLNLWANKITVDVQNRVDDLLKRIHT